MWTIGNVTKEELKRLKKMGYEVTIVDVPSFNKALDPKYDSSLYREDLENTGELLVSIYVNEDLFDRMQRLEP